MRNEFATYVQWNRSTTFTWFGAFSACQIIHLRLFCSPLGEGYLSGLPGATGFPTDACISSRHSNCAGYYPHYPEHEIHQVWSSVAWISRALSKQRLPWSTMKTVPLLRIGRETFEKTSRPHVKDFLGALCGVIFLAKLLVYKWLSNMTDIAQAINKGCEFEVFCNAMYNFTIQWMKTSHYSPRLTWLCPIQRYLTHPKFGSRGLCSSTS